MALDFAIQDDAGHPKHIVPIDWDTHDDIVEYATAFGPYALVLRMTDYFQNVRYDPEEVETLLNELVQLDRTIASKPKLPVHPNLLSTLRKMHDLCRQAIREGRRIIVIAD